MFVNNGLDHYKSCALKCPNGKHFFRLPKSEKLREMWLEKLPILTYNSNTRVCNNHFSKVMLAQSGRRLTRTAVPDMNLNPSYAIVGTETTSSSEELEGMIDHLLYNESFSSVDSFDSDNRELIYDQEDVQDIPTQSIPRPEEANLNTLFDYQWTAPSGRVYDIKEVPQFLFVLTAFRVNDTIIVPPSQLHHTQSCTADRESNEKRPPGKGKFLPKLSNVTISRISHSPKEQIKDIPVSRSGVKYVLHTPQESVICRDRNVQVNTLVHAETADCATQCDLLENDEEESEIDEPPNLDWINYFIEAHVTGLDCDKYECHICGEIAASRDSNLKHELIHKQDTLLCPQCGRLFSTNSKLKMHEKRVHFGNTPEVKKALRCPKFHCTKAFHSRRKLFDHIDDHTRGLPFKCNKCLRLFPSGLKLHSHKLLKKRCR